LAALAWIALTGHGPISLLMQGELNMDDQGASYQRVLDGVLANIRAGVYEPGGRLPPETELAERYGVRRSAVSWALWPLRWIGLIVGPRGGVARIAAEPMRSAALTLVDEAGRLRGARTTGAGGPSPRGRPAGR
jgi:GntR family phosphonate transport system transcriptional regulator